MARIETWYNQDLKQAVKVRYVDGNIFSMDNTGNIVGVNVYDGGSPVTLSGYITVNVIRADGATVSFSGVVSGNKAYAVLPQSACSVPGVISIIIKLVSGSDITTLAAVVANVYQSSTDTIVDPGTIIPSIETLIATINAAVEDINSAIASIPPDYSELTNAVENPIVVVNEKGNLLPARLGENHSGNIAASGLIKHEAGKYVYGSQGSDVTIGTNVNYHYYVYSIEEKVYTFTTTPFYVITDAYDNILYGVTESTPITTIDFSNYPGAKKFWMSVSKCFRCMKILL